MSSSLYPSRNMNGLRNWYGWFWFSSFCSYNHQKPIIGLNLFWFSLEKNWRKERPGVNPTNAGINIFASSFWFLFAKGRNVSAKRQFQAWVKQTTFLCLIIEYPLASHDNCFGSNLLSSLAKIEDSEPFKLSWLLDEHQHWFEWLLDLFEMLERVDWFNFEFVLKTWSLEFDIELVALKCVCFSSN